MTGRESPPAAIRGARQQAGAGRNSHRHGTPTLRQLAVIRMAITTDAFWAAFELGFGYGVERGRALAALDDRDWVA